MTPHEEHSTGPTDAVYDYLCDRFYTFDMLDALVTYNLWKTLIAVAVIAYATGRYMCHT